MKVLLGIVVAVAVGVIGYVIYNAQIPAPIAVAPVAATSTAAALPQIIPGTPSVRYTDPRYNFSMFYPSTAIVRAAGFDGYLPLTQTPVVAFALNPDLFQGTNLEDAGIYVGATSTPAIVANCTSPIPNSGETAASSSVMISGAPFGAFNSIGGAAGSIYQEKIFRAVENGSCLEFVELLHSGNIANYPSGAVAAFDQAKFSGILDAMINTLAVGSSSQK